MSDTPRTDAVIAADTGDSGLIHELAQLARELERELTIAAQFKKLAESLSSLAVDLKADRDLARAKLIEIIGCAEELGKTGRMAPMYFNAADIDEMKKAAGLPCE